LVLSGRLGGDGRLGHGRENLDEVTALAALHAHRSPGDLVVGDLVLRLALFAEEFHPLSRRPRALLYFLGLRATPIGARESTVWWRRPALRPDSSPTFRWLCCEILPSGRAPPDCEGRGNVAS